MSRKLPLSNVPTAAVCTAGVESVAVTEGDQIFHVILGDNYIDRSGSDLRSQEAFRIGQLYLEEENIRDGKHSISFQLVVNDRLRIRWSYWFRAFNRLIISNAVIVRVGQQYDSHIGRSSRVGRQEHDLCVGLCRHCFDFGRIL